MSKRRTTRHSIWDSQALLAAFTEYGIKTSHAMRLWNHLIRHPSSHWSDLPDLPKAAKLMLDDKFAKFTTRVIRCATSKDGETTKLLIALQDGQQVEAVIMHYDTRATYEDAIQDGSEDSPALLDGDGTLQPRPPIAGDTTTGPQAQSHDGLADDFHSCDEQSSEDEDTAADCQGLLEAGQQGTGDGMLVGTGPDVDGVDSTGRRGAIQGEAINGPSNGAPGSGAHLPHGSCDGDGGGGDGGGGGGQGSFSRGTSVVFGSESAASRSQSVLGDGRQRRRRGGRHEPGAGHDSSVVVCGARRSTLCVSSQVGCQMGCTFCATGTMGLKGNLTAGEIIEQLVHANAVARVRNIVFMGMGEPLANYEPVRAAVRLMTDSRAFALSRKHVTLSTVGVVPRIKQLAADLPGISLALSLHAPTQALRATIVPSARAYPLEKLMQAVRQYQVDSGQRVFMEYVMLAGVNDGAAEAHALGALLSGHNATLNLIPWNPVIAAASAEDKAPAPMAFRAPDMADVFAFQAIIKEKYGIPTTVRQEKGQDISGACGQLVIQHQDQQQQQDQGQEQQEAVAAPAPAAGCGQNGSSEGGSGTMPGSQSVTKTGACAPGQKQQAGLQDIEELR